MANQYLTSQFDLNNSGEPSPEGFAPEDTPQEELPGSTTPDFNIPGWDDYRLRQLGRRLLNEAEEWFEAIQQRVDSLTRYRRSFEMMRKAGIGPWARAADIPSEATYVACTNHTTRLNQQIVNANPPFSCVAKDIDAVQAAPRIEEALTAVFDEAEWACAAAEVHGLLPRDGNCFFRTTFETETRRKPVLQVEHDDELTQALIQSGMDAPAAMYEGLKKDREGRVVRKIGFENEVVYHGLRFKAIPFEDGILIPARVRDWRQARGIGEVLMVSGEELRAGAKKGTYLKDAVDDLLRFPGDDPVGMQTDQARWERLEAQGIDLDAMGEENWDDPEKLYADYRCYHLCYRGDWNGDGEMEWARILIHADDGLILKFQYLPWAHGKPEYVLFPYIDRPGELLGMGMAELISGYQDAETAVLCQLINHADLQINIGSGLIVGRGAGLDVDAFQMVIGKPLMIEGSVSEILPVPMNPLPPEHYNLLNILKERRDLATRSTNSSVGKEAPGSQTLGELQILTAAGNLQFEDAAAGVARVWADVFDQGRWLVSQFGDGGEVKYRKTAASATQLTGDEESTGGVPQAAGGVPQAATTFGSIDSETLRVRVDIVPTGIQQLSDVQSRIQQAYGAWQLLSPDPDVAGNPEVKLLMYDYILTSMRVPLKDKIIDLIRQGIMQRMAAEAAALQQQQAAQAAQAGQQGAEQEAQHAQAQAALQAGLAEHGIPMPGEGPPIGPDGHPMTAAQVPGNGAQPVGPI